jgi:hypothetical protein
MPNLKMIHNYKKVFLARWGAFFFKFPKKALKNCFPNNLGGLIKKQNFMMSPHVEKI